MEAERLNNILHIINGDFSENNIIAISQNFVTSFTNNIQSPNPQHSINFNTAKDELKVALSKCISNNFVPSQFKILNSIGGHEYIGMGLLDKFESIMNENILTPGEAVQKVSEHFTKVNEFYTAVQNALVSFKTLKIDFQYTEKGQYEIGFLLPCKIFNNDLEGLQKEISLINRHMKSICEISGGDNTSPQIRSVSSGSLEVFLNSLPEVAQCIGECIEKITFLYLAILQIRKHRIELKEEKVPKNTLDPLEKYEKTKAKEEIEKIAEEIFSKYHKTENQTRDNELKIALRKAIEFFASRIDKGADIEVTPPEEYDNTENEQTEGQEQKTNRDEKERIKILQEQGRALLKITSRSEENVLALPDPDDEGSEKGSKKANP